jgi:cobalt-zinc-cadmium efflux system membrane fusion protein
VRTRAGVVARPVKAGGKDGNHVLILSGVKPGEQVVVAGTSALKSLAMGE